MWTILSISHAQQVIFTSLSPQTYIFYSERRERASNASQKERYTVKVSSFKLRWGMAYIVSLIGCLVNRKIYYQGHLASFPQPTNIAEMIVQLRSVHFFVHA